MVGFSFDGKPLGLLNIRNPPPKGSEAHFAESGIAFIKRRYGIEDVVYGEHKNSNDHNYHRFDAIITDTSSLPFEDAVKADPKGYKVLMAVFFDTRTSGTEAQKLLREMYGCYQFEFVIPNSKASEIAPEIETILKSFDLPESTKAEQAVGEQPVTPPRVGD